MTILTYRGHVYESDRIIEPMESKPIVLTYRGIRFEYQPKSVPTPLHCALSQDGRKPIKLVYRGQAFDVMPSVPHPYRRPGESNLARNLTNSQISVSTVCSS